MRFSAVFIAVCMVLIAGSLGYVGYLRFGLNGEQAALLAFGVLVVLAIYNLLAARTRDRTQMTGTVLTMSRNAQDLARQLAEFGARLTEVENKIDTALGKAAGIAQPLVMEIEELSTLVKHLADSVAAHDLVLSQRPSVSVPPSVAPLAPTQQAASAVAVPTASAAQEIAAPPSPPTIAAFAGLDRTGIVAAVKAAVEGGKIDLYLQPVVTLPQRKVRYYEALSRLKTEKGDVVAAADFLPFVETGGLMAALDNMSVLRCVQVVRRLLLNNREIGLFCNLSTAVLTDASFGRFVEFIEANRAIASSLVFEFSQRAIRAMGPIEFEGLAALAERGFRFSMDQLTDLRVEPRELTDRGFRFIKVPASLLLNRAGGATIDIHPADFSDLLSRFGIALIAERIETESTVVDLLDYDVRFGQGLLFAAPRPVRADALQSPPTEGVKEAAAPEGVKPGSPKPEAGPPLRSALAQLARLGSARP